MERLCLECGLLFTTPETKRIFKKKDIGRITACEYCRGRHNIDITDAKDIAPIIIKVTDMGFSVIGHSVAKNSVDGKYEFAIMINNTEFVTGNSFDLFERVFDECGAELRYCYMNPISEDDSSSFIVGARFNYDGDYVGHISSAYNNDMTFTSYSYELKRSEMIIEFNSILERVANV